MFRRRALAAVPLCLCAGLGAAACELRIDGARVMDPASGFAQVASICISEGRISAVGEALAPAAEVIDGGGLIASPGFIDLHQHGQHEQAYALSVQDGVTATFEIEVAATEVDEWYAARAGGQYLHHGVGAGHIQARMDVFDDPSTTNLPTGAGAMAEADERQQDAIVERLRRALDQGAVAVGMGPEYTPGASAAEIDAAMALAADYAASVHIHLAAGLQGLHSAIAAAAREQAHLHVVHVNSSAGDDLPRYLAMIEGAQAAGAVLSVEAYPYGASMTRIEAAKFSDWPSWPEEKFARFQLARNLEWLDRERFAAERERGGIIIYHGRSEVQTRQAMTHPGVMIASDGFIDGSTGHPRAAGTFSRVLGRYVREDGALGLMEALEKMTILPARVLERRVPAMARKGRICVGCDADLVLFDPDTVIDRASFAAPGTPSVGIEYVLVAGVPVVHSGELRPDVRPGRALRAPATHRGGR